jgi:hypothetical protein
MESALAVPGDISLTLVPSLGGLRVCHEVGPGWDSARMGSRRTSDILGLCWMSSVGSEGRSPSTWS